MDITQAILTVDMDMLYECQFHTVKINLANGIKRRTIKVSKKEGVNTPFYYVEYHISNAKYVARVISDSEGYMPTSLKRRIQEELAIIREQLDKYISFSSLSVYRADSYLEASEPKNRNSKRLTSTVDIRLSSIMTRLTQYQLELSNKARDISTALQKEVLTSLLYTNEKNQERSYFLDIDYEQERKRLSTAYRQLGLFGAEINRKVNEHIDLVKTNIENLKQKNSLPVNLGALEAFKQTSKVVEMSLTAEKNVNDVFKPIHSFISILKNFMPGKNFEFKGGELKIEENGNIPVEKLSSGEKQLLILFIEALLQKQEPYIFIADEPELSLHISWQANILPTIIKLNPNAQIIVATHSPEIAGKYKNKIINMEKILHG